LDYDFVKETSFKVAGTVKIASTQYQYDNTVLWSDPTVTHDFMG
jgi:hypothetical protein